MHPAISRPGAGIKSGTDDPVQNVIGKPGDLYRRVDFDNSSLYVHVGEVTDNISWVKMGDNSTLLFGASSMSTSTTKDFLQPGNPDRSAITPAAVSAMPIARGGILKNLKVRHGSPKGNGNDIIYKVLVDLSETGIEVTLASTGQESMDEDNFFVMLPDSRINIEATKASGIGTSPKNIIATLGFL